MKPPGSASFPKLCVVTLMLVSYTGTFAVAAPKGGRVVSGTASFQQDGNLTVITTGNRSIINYQGFDVGANEIVRFVQPNANSSVLNRVLSPDPTNIFGQIQANGNVVIANPYGVFFQNGSVLNVGGIYAAAGRISNEDFSAGRLRFTDLKGDVRNDGVLAADNRIALLGANVVNAGTLRSAQGLAMMVSGDEVYVGPRDGNIFVQANGRLTASTAAAPAAGSITNRGTVAAPRVLLGAGDMYSTAIVNAGLLQGRNVTVNAGPNGRAMVGGKLDASSTAANARASGQGGKIQVLGGSVALQGATLDASGPHNGGSVRVGGDFHGVGALPRAQTTTVDAATTIHADATGPTGSGGTVVLWSDERTTFNGQISARGADSGGSVEVSGHNALSYAGFTDLQPTVAGGRAGSLLLDPLTITVQTTATPTTNPAAGGTAAFGDDPDDATISPAVLAAALSGGTLTLQAVNDIRFNESVTAAGTGSLTLQAGHDITFADNVVLTLGVGKFTAVVRDPGAASYNPTAGGRFTMGTGSAILATGGVNISGGPIQVTSLNTASSFAARPNGDIVLDSGTAAGLNVTANSLDTSSTAVVPGTSTGTPGGNISIASSGAVTASNVNSSSTGERGGSFTVGASAGGTAPTSIDVPVLNTRGSTGTNGGPVSLTSLGTITRSNTPTLTGNTSLTGTNVVASGFNGAGYDLSLNLSVQQVNLSTVFNVKNFSSTGAGGTLANANFSTTGSQFYGSLLTLGGNVTLSTGSGGIRLAGVANAAPYALTLSPASGTTEFTQPVGTAANPLAGLNVTGGAAFNGGEIIVTTNGNQSYSGALAVNSAGATTLTSNLGTITAGSVGGSGSAFNVNALGTTFGGINLSGGAVTFGVGGGTANFNGAINARGLSRTGAGQTNLNGGTVTTNGGGQLYGPGVLVLGADTTLTDISNGAINLPGAVRSSDNNAWTFTLLTNGRTTFGGPAGTTDHPLGRLTVGGPGFLDGSTYFNVDPSVPSVSTVNRGVGNNDGAQTYYNPVFLMRDAVLQSTRDPAAPAGTTEANIDLRATVDTDGAAARSLTVNTPGSEFFRGLVGNNSPLLGLATDVRSATYAADPQGQAQFLMTLPTTLPAGKSMVAGVNTLAGGVTINDTAVFGVANSASARVPTTVSGLPSLNTPTVTTTGAQNYPDGVLLTRDTVLQGTTLAGSGINVPPGTNPLPNLTLDLSGQRIVVPLSLVIPGVGTFAYNNFGNVVGIRGFASVGNGGTTLLGGEVSFPGYQYYYGNPATPNNGVTLAGNTLLTSTGNANIGFGGVLNGGYQLAVSTGGDTYFDGLAGTTASPLNGIEITNPAGTTHFDVSLAGQAAGTAGVNLGAGGLAVANRVDFSVPGSVSPTNPTVRTAGVQTYRGAATLGQNTVLTNTTGGNVSFNGTVDGAFVLTLNTAGNENFLGNVGSITPLRGVVTDDDASYRGGAVVFGNPATPGATFTLNTRDDQAAPGTPVQTYNDQVSLLTPATLTSQSSAGGGAILFGSTVDRGGSTLAGLTLNTPDRVTFNSTVGATAAPTLLNITAPGGTFFNNPAGLSTLAPLTADVNVGFGGVTINGPVRFNVAGSTLADNSHPTVASTGAQTYNGPFTLAAPTSLYVSGSGDIALSGTVDGAFGLAVNTNGNEIFGGVIGGTTALASLATDNFPTLTVGGEARFAFDVAGRPAGVRVGAGGLSIRDAVRFNVTGTSLANPTVLVFGGGTQNYAQTATLLADTFLVGTDSATQAASSVYTGGGAVAFGSNITGPTTGTVLPSLTIRTGAGPTVFQGAINVGRVDVTGARVTVAGTIDRLNLLSVAPNDGTPGPISLNGGLLGGNVTSSNGQFYGSPVLLTDTTVLTDLQGGDVTFASKLDGAYHLTINTAGGTIFNGPVGGDAPLLSLTTDAPGVTYLNGGLVRTGFQLPSAVPFGQFYGDRVVLEADTVLDALNAGPGVVSFGGRVDSASVDTPFRLSVAGDAVTFGGAVGGVGGQGAALRSLIVTGGRTFLNAGRVTTTEFQTYGSTLGTTIGRTTVLNAGTNLSFLGAVDGVATIPPTDTSLTLNAPAVLFGGVVGQTPLTSLVVNGALSLNGGLVSTRLGQAYNGMVTLGAGALLTSANNGDVVFARTLDGAFGLTVNTGGLTEFRGKVGGESALASLVTDNQGVVGERTRFSLDAAAPSTNAAGVNVTGAVTINDAVTFNIANTSPTNPAVRTAAGGQRYGGAVTLEQSTVLTSTGGGDLVFSRTVDGTFRLVLNTGGTTQFDGLVGGQTALAGLVTDAGGTTRINGGGVRTLGTTRVNGTQRYDDNVVLGADAVLSSGRGAAAVGGSLLFNGRVNGAYVLTLNTREQTVFNGVVGDQTPLAGLTTDNGGGPDEATRFDMAVGGATAGVTVNGAITINDAVIFNVAGSSLAQPSVLTLGNGTQSYASPVTLAANTVLTTAAGLPGVGGAFAGGGAIRFDSTQGVVSTGGSDLLVRAGAGNASFASEINVGSLDLGGALVSFRGPVTLPGRLSVEPNGGGLGGAVTLTGGSLTTVGTQVYNAAVILGGNTTLTSQNAPGGGITFNAALDGAFALTLNTPGDEVFNGLVGSTIPPVSLTTDAVGTVGGAARFNMDATGATAGVNVAGGLRINDAAVFNVASTGSAVGSPVSVLTGEGQNYRGAATLVQNTILAGTGAGNLVFGSTVDGPFALTLSTAGNEVFNGLVGSTVALASLTTDADARYQGGETRFLMDVAGATPGMAGVNVGGPLTVNDQVVFNVANGSAANPTVRTVGGAQTYNGPALLSVNTFLSAAGGADLAFNSTVNGPYTLTTGADGRTIFNAAVGGAAPLASLTVSAGGTATLLNAGTINTTGAQFYGSAVRLQRDAVLTSTNAASGNGGLTFGGAVNGTFALTLTTPGSVVFNGSVGNNAALGSLLVSGGGAATRLNAGVFNTVGGQFYGNSVQLQQDATLTSVGPGGGLTFDGPVDGASVLTLTTPGAVVLNGAVGGAAALASLTISGGGAATLLNAGTVNTTGLQSYGNAVRLQRGTLLKSQGTGTAGLMFDGTINGAQALTLATSGAVALNGAVGNDAALLGLTIAGGGVATRLNAATINTTGLQSYGSAVQLLQATRLTTAADGGLVFGSTLDGAQALTLTTPGAVTFNGAVGANDALTSLAIAGGGAATLLNAGTVTTTGLQAYGNAVRLQRNTTLASTNAATATTGGLTFSGAVDGGYSLALNSANRIQFNGAVGSGQALTRLVTSGSGPTVFDADGRVTTTGLQQFGNPVRLRVDGVFTSGTGTGDKGTGVSFSGTVDGRGRALTVNTQGQTFFGGLVGGTAGGNTQLRSITTDAGGTTVFQNSGTLTTGRQIYGDAVSLRSDTVLTSTSDAASSGIRFGDAVNGGSVLTVNTPQEVVFNAAVGFASPLVSLNVNAGNIRFGGSGARTLGVQRYNGAATLGADVEFTSDRDAVVFQGDVDGTGNDTTVLRVNAPGESAFNGNVGATRNLASVTVSGPLSIGGGFVLTSGNQLYADTVAARPAASADTRLVSRNGDVRFDRAVSANGGLSVQGNRVGAGDSITTAGNLSLDTTPGPLTPLLLLTGRSYTSTNGEVFLNSPGSATTEGGANLNAGIVLSNPGTTVISGSNFTMGSLQKLFSTGSVDIETRGGTATLGDIAARNTLRVNASRIVLLSRPPGTAQAGRPDDGLNFVAGRAINFGGARITFSDTDANRTANFITANGVVTIERVAGISLFKDPQIDGQFRRAAALDLSVANLDRINAPGGIGFVDQPVGGGSQALDTAAALSGALPDQKPLDVASDITISASQMEELKKLGIHPRLAKQTERGSAASKRALFAQLVDGQDPENYGRLQPIKGGVSRLEPSDFVVVVDRMGEREVQAILQEFGDLYGKNKEKAPVIGTAFQDAFNEYTVQKQTADPAGFGDYLQSQPGKYPAVESAVRNFDGLFGHIERLGLTDKEVAKSEEHITSDLGVSGISSEELVKVINGLRKKLPPAKKAASTKLPPAAPVRNPAPGASTPAQPAAPVRPSAPATAPATPAAPLPAATPAPANEEIPEIMPVPDAPPAASAPPTAGARTLHSPLPPEGRRTVALR